MLIWGLLILPLLSAVVITLVTRRHKDLSSYISIGAVFVCFLIVFPYFLKFVGSSHAEHIESSFRWIGVPGMLVEIGYLIDPLSALMLFIVTFVGTLIHIYSRGYMHGEPGFSRFFACLSLFIFSMLGIVLANNLIMIYVFWELVGLSSYLLIGYYFEKPAASDAAKKAFLVNRIGDFGFALGIFVIFYAAGSFNFLEIGHQVHAGHLSSHTMLLGSLLLFCGAVGKSAQFPLHVWLPDAMEGPTPVSALIHAATMVAAGVYMLARISFLLYAAPPAATTVIAYTGAITALGAALLALGQSDIKRVIAFSTLSSLGYMVMSVGVGSATAGMFYLMTHAFFKALLFLCAGSVIHACHTNDIWHMGALSPKMKITTATFILGSLAMMGVFPFSGFWSKDEILSATFAHGDMVLYGAGVLTAFITGIFMTKLIIVTFYGKKRYHGTPHESPPTMTIPLMILAVFAVFVGLVGLPNIHPNFGSFLGLHGAGHGAEHGFNMTVAISSTIVVFAGIIIGLLTYHT
ncbi:MAG: NADH-quinone oxidoreductase subunit L, partial [Thermodesulfobacteriota bacterium]